ncbi:TlpA disulfide reductase family protein [Flavobacterium sp.]|uniref:TlpA family protein disulfide reductase n=1 Tax=Flavobacterium sp. TaxID=239 RepID=UPI0008BCF240|nr:TlpA disulfide reductase family protein [Flavobacterium sp.]OGS60903.1 MAG: thioredoxin [Flavobacteria bacterium GWF1_32_7]HBD26440.1 TlpA family protein disulfide reductase [Flavobacterium sp.]
MKKAFFLFFVAIFSGFAQNTTNTVSLNVKIANRFSDTITISSGRTFKQKVGINKKGEFQTTFEASKDGGIYRLNDGNEGTTMFLKNGYDLTLTVDTKDFDETIVYKGKGANENNYLAKKALADEKFEMELETLLEGDEAKFKEELAKKKANDISLIDGKGFDETLVKMLRPSFDQEEKFLLDYYNQKLAAKKMEGIVSPSFDYENHKGGKTKLEDLRGKYVYIDVWATWCGPCLAEIPHLKKVEAKYHGKNIEFVSISVDTEKDYEKWKKMVVSKELGGIQLFADKNWTSDFIKAFGINSIPRFILIGPDGKVIKADAARPSSDSLTELLDGLVK